MTHHFPLKHQLLATSLSVSAMILLSGCAGKRLSYNHELLGSRDMIPPPYAEAVEAPQGPAAKAPAAPQAESFQPQDAAFTAVPPETEPLPPAAEPLPPAVEPVKKAPAPKPAPRPVVKSTETRKYVVKKGDTLGGIAAEFGMRWPALAKANPGINPNRLLVGQTLVIPAGGKAAAKPAPVKKASDKKVKNTQASSAVNGIHTVVSGENIWVIARRYKVKRDDIRTWNNLSSDVLRIGQKLRVKADAPAVAARKTTPKKAAAKPENKITITEEPVNLLGTAAPAEAPAQNDAQDLKKLEEGINTPPETVVAPQKTAVSNLAHSVMSNDTLESIAKMYDTTVEAILKQNPQVKTDADLKEGMSIIIPYTK